MTRVYYRKNGNIEYLVFRFDGFHYQVNCFVNMGGRYNMYFNFLKVSDDLVRSSHLVYGDIKDVDFYAAIDFFGCHENAHTIITTDTYKDYFKLADDVRAMYETV